jgi:hypothetical protein
MRKIKWTSDLTQTRGVIEVDDDAKDDDIDQQVWETAQEHIETDWKEVGAP